jgi:hypothetical protein
VLPWETLRARDDRRARRRTELPALEQLEGRQLLAYSSLGYSLPDLHVTGQAGPVASWGGPLTVTAFLQNTGASTIDEPTALIPSTQIVAGPDGLPVPPYVTPSSADVQSNQIAIFLSPNRNSLANAIQIGTFTAPATGTVISQNNAITVPETLTLPPHPVGFPTVGRVYIRLVANVNNAVTESSTHNNISPPIPVRLVQVALPSLRATAFGVPATMQPGDTIAPTIQITNEGTAPMPAGLQVAVVASVTPDFNLGSSIVALYTIPTAIPAGSSAPIRLGRRHPRVFTANLTNNVINGVNVINYTGAPATLPSTPAKYFLGVVIDPNNLVNQLSLPSNRLEQIREVGQTNGGLPPAGVSSSALTAPFPNPPDGVPIGVTTSTVP